MFAGMTFKDWFSVFTSVVGVFVIPFTLVGIWRSRVVSQQADNWKARQEEIGTYNDINTRYAEFLRMLLANPDVDIGEFETPRKLSKRTERYKRNLMYAVLVSIMERAYLLYTAIDRFEKEQLSQDRTVLVKLLDSVQKDTRHIYSNRSGPAGSAIFSIIAATKRFENIGWRPFREKRRAFQRNGMILTSKRSLPI
jgi:hypothetical protein